jgi:hypothetical protein
VLVALGVFDDRRRWIPLDNVGAVVHTERAQCLFPFLDDVFTLPDECVDDLGLDDCDALACGICYEEDVYSGVGPVCDFGGVMECRPSTIAPVEREQNILVHLSPEYL